MLVRRTKKLVRCDQLSDPSDSLISTWNIRESRRDINLYQLIARLECASVVFVFLRSLRGFAVSCGKTPTKESELVWPTRAAHSHCRTGRKQFIDGVINVSIDVCKQCRSGRGLHNLYYRLPRHPQRPESGPVPRGAFLSFLLRTFEFLSVKSSKTNQGSQKRDTIYKRATCSRSTVIHFCVLVLKVCVKQADERR